MTKARKPGPRRRLLDAWIPPRDAGPAIGVIATTFTLDTGHFEEECLSRFLGVQSHPTRDGALYRIERDERMAQLQCAAVVADIHHCAGQRSLRWDLLAARPAKGVMHAKISLLAWQDHVRIIVASANLTPDGYRRNQECFGVVDFDDELTEAHLLDPLLKYITKVLALTHGAAQQRAVELLTWVGKRLPRHDMSRRRLQRHFLFVGPGREGYFSQLKELVPRGTIDEAHVVSPFFNPDLRAQGPEVELWSMLRQRGAATVHYHVAAEQLSSGNGWKLQMPRHVLDSTPEGRSGVESVVHPIDVARARGDVGVERRPLHAKTLTLRGPDWLAAAVGSSNFTTAGTAQPHASNWEANIVYIVKGGNKELSAVESRLLRGDVPIEVGQGVEFEPAFDPDGEALGDQPCLPAFFESAELTATDDTGYALTLALAGRPPEDSWAVCHDGEVLLDRGAWIAAGHPAEVNCRVTRRGRVPSVLRVTCGAEQHVLDWPVTCRTVQAVPPPEGVPTLTLAAISELLASGKSLHEALRAYVRSLPTDDEDPEARVELCDPHAKVDTSGFLMKRVQQACWAFVHLRRRLEDPVPSQQALEWRLNGPLGGRAVLKAMLAQCDPALPDERAFLLTEFLGEMRSVRLKAPPGTGLPPQSQEMLAEFLEELERAAIDASSLASASLKKYTRAAQEAQL